MQLHSRSLFFTRRRQQQSVRNRHPVITISYSHNKSRTILHTVAMSKPPLHSSSTAAICTQSAPSDHDLVLTQRGYSITSCNFTLEASSLRITDITQAPLNHFDLVLMQGAYNNPHKITFLKPHLHSSQTSHKHHTYALRSHTIHSVTLHNHNQYPPSLRACRTEEGTMEGLSRESYRGTE